MKIEGDGSYLIDAGPWYTVIVVELGRVAGVYETFLHAGDDRWTLAVAYRAGDCVDVNDVRGRLGAYW
jgi:hypothetical protein